MADVPAMFVNRREYDIMLASLRAEGLPETHEQLLIEAERVVGPCTISVYDEDDL